MALAALALNCTLKGGSEESSTRAMLGEVLEELQQHDVEGRMLRIVDLNIKPGITSDEGDGDDWPRFREMGGTAAPGAGLEPATLRLTAGCSAN